MKPKFIRVGSPLRNFLPFIQKTRQWCWKYQDRVGIRLLISGGKVRFMDAELNFPEDVGLRYCTSLFWNGPYAYEDINSRIIGLLIKHSRLFLDIGSNIGIYSVYAGVARPGTVAYAFEPVPSIWRKNVAFHRANNLPEKNVLGVALSDKVGAHKIYLPVYANNIEEELTATLRADSWQAHEAKVEEFEIQCLTLDAFAEANNLPEGACSLKVDVENYEAGVLRGGTKFITARRPWIHCEILSCEEFDPATKTKRNNNRETLALIGELNYTPFAVTSDGLFRMTADDFSRPREMKDFLLAPAEKVPAEVAYLPFSSLAELLPVV
jgi:FkbM family methyltransferase